MSGNMHAVERERIPRLSLGEERNMVTQLIVVNLTIYILLLFTWVLYNMEGLKTAQFDKDIMNWVMLPADPAKLLTRPWTLITAMFAHISFWQVFSNMVWLWCFGSILQNLAGHQRILPVYLYGGICGAVFYVVGMQVIPSFHALIPNAAIMGASASVMALAFAATALAPKYRLFPLLSGGIPLWVITLIFTGMHIYTHVFSVHNNTIYPLLLGGSLSGVFFIQQWKRGRDLGKGLNRLTFKMTHLFHPANQQLDPDQLKTILQPVLVSEEKQQKIDIPETVINDILDKINDKGIKSLTQEERDILLKASREVQ
jgi:membrane associated rhomboid family serine protease